MTRDVAAELRARAEEARAAVERSKLLGNESDRALFAVRHTTFCEAASLVESSQEARVTCDRCGAEQDERTCCGRCGAAIGFTEPAAASTRVREDNEARVEMLDERIRRVFGILNDPEIPDNLARVMSRDKLRPLLRPAPPTLKGEDG